MIAFPDGGEHSYWHNRPEGGWGRYVMREVIPTVSRRFGIDPHRVAIGGISMGGFGAYDLALLHPGRFCAVGGHSPALWFEGGETAPGAFESAADFERNDVVGMVRGNPDAFAGIRVWNDSGDEDPFRGYDEGFVEYLRGNGADLSAHSWPRRPRQRLLERPLGRLPALLRQRARALLAKSVVPYGPWATTKNQAMFQRPGEPAGGVPGGGGGPQLSRPSVVSIGIFGPAIAGVSRLTSAIALTRESTSRTSLFSPW